MNIFHLISLFSYNYKTFAVLQTKGHILPVYPDSVLPYLGSWCSQCGKESTLGRGKDMLFSPHSEIESGTKLKTEDRGLVKTRRHAEEVLPGLIAAGVAVGIQDDKKLQQCCNSARCRIYRDQKGGKNGGNAI
ncbi:hypothetical protein MG293_011132 [Ovis ammon polii]|uniref:Uncharacterized protein n=1 Tax=Ovis ammon polii TaxID=230172 RepID=A0AAD4U898_OVIAM|nr:hypothetical protein MG293_011132 [Ovis ammon polii]